MQAYLRPAGNNRIRDEVRRIGRQEPLFELPDDLRSDEISQLRPGVTLAAGTYVFERAPSGDNIYLVRVSTGDRKQVLLTAYTQLIARPADLPADRFVWLGEPRRGAATPIKAWFPAGERMGNAFTY